MVAAPTYQCNMMQLHMYYSKYGVSAITMEDPAMQTNLAMDLNCLKSNIEYFKSFTTTISLDSLYREIIVYFDLV